MSHSPHPAPFSNNLILNTEGARARSFVMFLVMALLAGLLSVGFVTVNPTRAQAAPGDPIVCTPGVVYALDGVGDPTGTLYQVTTSTGALTPVGAFPSTPTQQINALAIPAGGGSAYALRATATAGQLELMRYTTATNSSAVIATVASPHGYVAGAIDPTTGYFWWAGPSATAGVWSLSAFDIATNKSLGVQFSTSSNNGSNGDLAFDNTGRLYLVTSAGDGTLANNQLRYYDKPFTTGGTMSGVLLTNTAPADQAFNGIAFGADGFLYTLTGGGGGGGRMMYQINPSTGAVVATRTVTQGGVANQKATDLGSCASPSTLSLVKDIQSRYLPTDQFGLAIAGNGVTRNNTGVTSGSSTGPQLSSTATAGPVLAVPGATYTIAETGASGANLANYVSSYVCVNETANDAVVASGTTTSGRVTVPQNLATGASVVCTITNTAKTPGIDLEKRVSGITDVNGNGITDLGDQIRWEFDVTNTGSTALTAVSIADDVLSNAGITITCNPNALPVGASVICTADSAYTITAADVANGKVVNTAVAQGTPPGKPPIQTPPSSTTTPLQSYTVTKTVDVASTTPGGVVKYTVTVTNTGQVAYTDSLPATFTDDLSGVLDDATYNNDVSTGGSVTGSTLSWTGPLDVGASATVTYSVTVKNPNTGDNVLENAVTPTGPGGTCATGGDCATSTPVQSYTVAKVSDSTSTVPGGTVTYTVTVTNTGEVDYTASSPATFTDDLTGVLDDAVYNNDVSAGGSVSGTTLTWSGALAVGASADVTYSVTVNNPDTGNRILTNAVVPTAPGGSCDEDGECITNTPVRGLQVVKTTTATDVVPGAEVPYTITITNTGQVPFTASDPASFTDDLSAVLDDATYNNDAASSSGAGTSYSTPVLSWSGPLAIGATVTITYSVTVNSPISGDGRLRNAVVTPPTTGGNCPPGSTDPDCIANVPARAYTVAKTSDSTTALPGDIVNYTVTVTNTGSVDFTTTDPATFSDDLTKVLDDATYNNDISAGGALTGSNLTWSGALAAGQTIQVTYSVTVNNPDTGDHVLTNGVVPTSPGGSCAEEGGCVTVTPIASYTVAKATDVTSATPGDTITYTVTVTNTGAVAYTATNPATFTDDLSAVLDDSTYNDDVTAGGTVAGNTLSWTGPLAVGATIAVTYTVTVNDPNTGDNTLTNAVVPTSPGGSCDPNDDCTTTTPVQSYTVVKTSDPATTLPGGIVSYTVTVTNTGAVAYTDAAPASFTDDLTNVLDDATYNGDVTAGGTVTGNTLTWSGPLAIGSSTTITYTVTVNNPNAGDNVLTNVVVPTAPGGDCATDGDCTTTTPVQSFTVAKTSTPASALPGGVVSYTVTVTNTGAVAYTDAAPASFTDDLTNVLDDATYNGDVSAGGTVTGNTLTWSGPLAIGATTTVTYTVTVNNPLTGDHTLTNAVVPTAPGGDCDPDGACVTNTPVQAFTVAKTVSAVTATPGDTVTYTVTVTNTGAVAYTDAAPASFSDDLSKVLDDATYNGDVSTGGSVTGTTLTWSGALPVGGTSTVTYSVTIDNPVTGDNILTNAVVPTAPGGECATDDGCTTTTPIRGLRVEKTTTSTEVTPGDVVPYTITITNTGQVAYTDAEPASFTDDLTAVLDDATYNNDATSSSGSGVPYAAPTLAWSGPLAIGDTVTVTYSVTVNDPASGDRRLENTVSTPPSIGGNCPPGSNDPDCVANVPAASYTVEKSSSEASVFPGGNVTYTVTVTNTGEVAYTAANPATFTDDLSRVLDDATYNGDVSAGGFVEGNVLTWAGALPVGQRVQVTYSVTVDNPDVGDNLLRNVVRPTSPGGNCVADKCETETPVASYTVAKTSNATSTILGGTVTYTVLVANTGDVDYTQETPATFTDDLSDVLDDASYNGDASAGVTVDGNTLTWSGALAAGETIPVTYSVTVKSPAAGNLQLKNAVLPTGPGGTCDPEGDCVTETPIASYTVMKEVSNTQATVGDTVTFSITVKNTGAVAYTAAAPATFTDDLSSALAISRYNGDASGGASYSAPVLSWAGALGIGESTTVTYSVTVTKPGTIENVVVTPKETGANCPPGSVDPDCRTTTTVTPPPPAGDLAHTGFGSTWLPLLALLLGCGGLSTLLIARKRRENQMS